MDAKQEFKINRADLKSIFESIRFCGHQGIPIRGHRDENATANFNCLVALIGKFNPDVEKYFGSENKVSLSSDPERSAQGAGSYSPARTT